MANTQVLKKEAELWLIEKLSKDYSYEQYSVQKEKLNLIWGGQFEYDVVVKRKVDNTIKAVYCLSCSEYMTSGNNPDSGKYHKIRGDILMMLGTISDEKYLVFTGKSMYNKIAKEMSSGRIPQNISLKYFNLEFENKELSVKVKNSLLNASNEMDFNT